MPYARKEQEVQAWRQPNGEITLLDVVRHAKPSVLIGVSGQAGAFTEDAVREMAKHTPRPVIFPLSNPTSRSEATPQDLMDWTEGRALIGTGSPFEPVNVGGKKIHIAQTNNSYIFPGLALGIIASKARRVTDTMVKAAAEELVRHLPTQNDKNASLLPPTFGSASARPPDWAGRRKTGHSRWTSAGCRRRRFRSANSRRISGNQSTFRTNATSSLFARVSSRSPERELRVWAAARSNPLESILTKVYQNKRL